MKTHPLGHTFDYIVFRSPLLPAPPLHPSRVITCGCIYIWCLVQLFTRGNKQNAIHIRVVSGLHLQNWGLYQWLTHHHKRDKHFLQKQTSCNGQFGVITKWQSRESVKDDVAILVVKWYVLFQAHDQSTICKYYTNMDLWWRQYRVLWIWSNNIDQGEAEVNIVAEDQ